MKKIFVKNRDLVVPGTLLAQGSFKNGRGTFKEGNRLYSSVVGLVRVSNDTVSVVPLEGPYIPEVGDTVIGKIVDVKFSNWIVDIGAPYQAGLRVQDVIEGRVDVLKTDLRKIFDIGDIIYAKIKAYNEINQIDLITKGMPFNGGPLKGGQLVKITPSKVPRLIGKGGSMINMIKNLTGTRIIVGQNGWVWVSGRKEELEKLAIEAILKVNRESHTQGLTDRVREMLVKRLNELKEQGIIEEIPQLEEGEGQ
ncbi:MULTISPECIES: exosome complex RNA-binding protein Rrp4 [Thermococcus]|uniref:Exosome complex component Rrp4 n=2 Tax=Thermococcus sibiricus TaxID=172049 RepID=C6A457_THESM|nr:MULTISPECIES: exosome complex RNA-binding protein Rrp4 [Thermococcus]KUK28005.1 MAG: putative exosome complex RNA-binding protein 1 [Thermococcus sp. 40_45]HII68219.1 KH domain-containing protein [Thermococcaceae archaeon]ACS90402.1 Probable exosome complex RNA-binding protein 1 [Thermococcus sibiricus MM 739]KUK17235.1 MAG: putative exosome complex RNA-binding protein 1 [Thermococcus sibiricus]MBC7094854.1 KH domain-containing protein [Thermococcus sp.]